MKPPGTLWSRRAVRLAGLLPRDRLEPAVLAHGLQPGQRGPWTVALSGGADSVALLLLLWVHLPEHRERLQAVHFNHRLRGRAAERDEAFCRDLCRGLRVKLRIGRRRVNRLVQNEAAARELRFACIDRVMRSSRSTLLWLGHQQNDVAETMLMRLARGSGAGGLAAPRPVQTMPDGRVHLRPMLGLKHSELTAALQAARIPWREDASNRSADYLRNRVRHQVLPVWEETAGRDAVAGAALSRSLLEDDDAALDAWAMQLVAGMPAGRLWLRKLEDVPRAVVRRILHRWLTEQEGAGDLSRQAFEQLLAAVQRGASTRHSIGPQAFAVIRRHELFGETGASK